MLIQGLQENRICPRPHHGPRVLSGAVAQVPRLPWVPWGSSLCSVASVSSSLFRMMVWVGVPAGARAVGVPAFLPSGLCSRWMWNLRCPFRLKLQGRDKGSGAALPCMPSSPSPYVPSLTAARRGGMKKASRWYGSTCAAAGPSCSWRQSCTGCTGEAAGLSAAPCGPIEGQSWGHQLGLDRQLPKSC